MAETAPHSTSLGTTVDTPQLARAERWQNAERWRNRTLLWISAWALDRADHRIHRRLGRHRAVFRQFVAFCVAPAALRVLRRGVGPAHQWSDRHQQLQLIEGRSPSLRVHGFTLVRLHAHGRQRRQIVSHGLRMERESTRARRSHAEEKNAEAASRRTHSKNAARTQPLHTRRLASAVDAV